MSEAPSMRENIRSYFVIYGAECDPNEITKHTGIAPSKTWRRGDIRYAKTGKHHVDSGWRIDVPEGVAPTLDAHLENLLDTLWESRAYLRTIQASCSFQATLVIDCHGAATAPPMSIAPMNIERLAALYASLDMDVYC